MDYAEMLYQQGDVYKKMDTSNFDSAIEKFVKT